MLAKIQKWGNSLGVRLPKQIAKNTNLKIGSCIEITSSGNEVIITPKQNRLDEILDNITEANMHRQSFNDDEPKGNESW